MSRTRPRPRFAPLLLRLLLAGAVAAPSALAQGGGGAGVDREAMWFAPTAEDWKRPCLVTWQRTWEDALAVSKETGKAILICVNMDGEIASEHYAGIRYRQPDIAALYEPYVTVIASVYRHNPRDHDEQGRRIVCPRFGTVTCGEHIAIEPGLYDQFFDGRRIAPRHIGVELDRKEMYDVFYAWDTDTIFNALRDGIANRPAPPPTARGDRTLLERVASADIEDRVAVEAAYQAGDRARRREILAATIALGERASVEVLRLALFDLDLQLNQLARRALASSSSESAIDLIALALRQPTDTAERDALIGALERIGAHSPRAHTLALVHRGLHGDASAVDVEDWMRLLADAPTPAAVYQPALAERLDQRAAEALQRPVDAESRLALAEAMLDLADDPRVARKHAKLLVQDARRAALEAEKHGAEGWRVNAALASAESSLGRPDEARKRAEAAMAGVSPEPHGRRAMQVLSLFADARQRAIFDKLVAKEEWPAQWLTDVHAAYRLLEQHPLGTDAQVLAHYDFLRRLGAGGEASRVLDAGLARFPDSWDLHDRLRGRILSEKGLAGLEEVYGAMLRAEDAPPNLPWFAGYASFVTAEFHRRAGNDGDAVAAYDRAIAHYEAGTVRNPGSRDSANHYIALALAGRARIAFEARETERALAEILASFERKPEAAASLDGLNLSPVDTAKMLRARLVSEDRKDLLAKLDTALGSLDPELLRLPAYEREVPPVGPAGGSNPRQGRGRRNR